MKETSSDYGDWLIGPDGTAHCLVAQRCLCGARIDFTHAPRLKTTETTLDTPLCNRCVDLNARRLRF